MSNAAVKHRYLQRLSNLRQLMAERELPALLITQKENIRYLCGFSGSTGLLLVTAKHAILATDFRYWQQADRQIAGMGYGIGDSVEDESRLIAERISFSGFTVYHCVGRLFAALPQLLRMVSGCYSDSSASDGVAAAVAVATAVSSTATAFERGCIGFESNAITVAQLDELRAILPRVTWMKASGLVEQLRAVKDDDVIVLLRKAIQIAEAGFQHLLQVIRSGMSERQVAWELEGYLRSHGAESLAFETIVASGPNSAMSHHRAGERLLEVGEPIMIDWGVVVNGYCSDKTRTIVLGKDGWSDDYGDAPPRFCEIYNIVAKAQQHAISNIKVGMSGAAAHALAYDIIATAGFGEYFGHSLGHGIGLGIHEDPRLSPLAERSKLPLGAVFTIEPGIYIPGWGGVRIEDMVVLREHGVELLTSSGS
jgi:Xaa-Pro aminopeptidase